MNNNWQMLPYLNYEFWELLVIIEDAVCNGFEFKVENHTVYYREREI